MLRKWLSYLLVILIAMQSIVAIADVHQSHQEDTQHIDFNHEHDTATDIEIQHDESGSVQYDCHHCCHCHGQSVYSLTALNNPFPGKASKDHVLRYQLVYSSNLISPDLRPPIV